MSVVIDANMISFASRLGISTNRMVEEYGLKSIDEIIEAEASQGNAKALTAAREIYNSPKKMIDVFRLNDVENKFTLLRHMDDQTRLQILPLLDSEDLVMGLYFFTQEKLLSMLDKVDISELVNVTREAFTLEQIVLMYTEEDLASFFQNEDLPRVDVMEQLKSMPPDVMIYFIEGVTGMPFAETDQAEFFRSIEELPDDKYREFMSSIDPDVQRQVVFQLFKEEPEYMCFFENETYTKMLNMLMKPEMVTAMIGLSQESLLSMNSRLPGDFVAIVGAQADTKKFAYFIMEHPEVLESAMMV